MERDQGNKLKKASRNLIRAAREENWPPTYFREEEIGRVRMALDRKRSVLLTGPEGVGKTSVVRGLASAAASNATPFRLRELSTSSILAGTKYIGEWQTKLEAIIREATRTETVLYVSDIGNLSSAGTSENVTANLLDGLRPHLEAGTLRLVAEATPFVQTLMERTPGFLGLFEQIAVAPLATERTLDLLAQESERLEVPLDDPTARSLVRLTGRFLAHRPQPGPALDLLERVRHYRAEKATIGEPAEVTAAFVERVFSIYSGLPLFVVSSEGTRTLAEIRQWFQEHLVGQRRAIEAVLETITLFKAGLNDPQRPLGTFLFVGPTGVGKTELGRLLARFVFGSAQRLLRFDLSEFKDYHSFEMLLGNPRNPDQPGRLVAPVRRQPFQVILLDELEKAHENVWDMLLQLLDEGRVSPPNGEPVSFRNTIVIVTSNVGAQEAGRSLGFGEGPDPDARAQTIVRGLEGAFRPELINRFGHVVVFDALTADEVRRIARLELARVLEREGIVERNLLVDVDDSALDLVIERGYDPRYGARALKRELQRRLVLPLAAALMEKRYEPGTLLRLTTAAGRIRVREVQTRQSRAHRAEREPVVLPDGGRIGRGELATRLEATRERVETLARNIDEPQRLKERTELEERCHAPDFWGDPVQAAQMMRSLDKITAVVDRVDNLRTWCTELGQSLARAGLRSEVERITWDALRLERSLTRVHRELVLMGSDGDAEALVEIREVAGGKPRLARDLLVAIYQAWATSQKMEMQWLLEPRSEDEPAHFVVRGRYAYGLLRREAGVHRVRVGEKKAVAVVRVFPWVEATAQPDVVAHLALKATGQYGGRVRSRLECQGGLVLQNDKTLAENRDLAAEVLAAWQAAPPAPDDLVRRIDLEPFLLKDPLTGTSSGRPESLKPKNFHDLLCQRLEATHAEEPGSP